MMKKNALYATIAVALIAVAGLGGYSCRQAEISNCRERGGEPITSPWYSQEWSTVRCLEEGSR